MPRGYRIEWDEALDNRLRELYPMHLDSEVASEIGVNYKSMRTRAKILGLEKGEGYEEYYKKRQSFIHRVSGANMRNSGQFKKGCKPNYTFTSNPPREMVEKRAATLRKRYLEDRIRIKYGLPPKMKYKLKVKYNVIDEK